MYFFKGVGKPIEELFYGITYFLCDLLSKGRFSIHLNYVVMRLLHHLWSHLNWKKVYHMSKGSKITVLKSMYVIAKRDFFAIYLCALVMLRRVNAKFRSLNAISIYITYGS